MPFEQHPMENFNRNNPYVIRAKNKYNTLSAKYEQLIRRLVVCSSYPALAAFLMLFAGIASGHVEIGIFSCVICPLGYFVLYRYAIKRTILDPANTIIEKVTKMSLDDVMNANLEVVDNAIGVMNECIGKVDLMMDFVEKFTALFSTLCLLVSLVWTLMLMLGL